MNPGRRLFVLVLTVLAFQVVVGACSPAPNPVPTASLSTSPSASAAPSSSAAVSAPPDTSPPASPGETTTVRTYFYLGGEPGTAGLVPIVRAVPQTQAVAGAAMTALLAGPTADESTGGVITSAVPVGSRLLGLSIKNGIATVDLSGEFESGGGSASVITRLGQVVYTLTQFPTVQSVAFEIEGRPARVFSSEGLVLEGPLGRDDYDDLLPAIYVDQPAYGAGIGNPARISGSANVFEATFVVTVLDSTGAPIAQTQAMATCGTGCRGTFDAIAPYSVLKAGWGTLRVWDGSAKDGSPENVREYPVWLTPAE